MKHDATAVSGGCLCGRVRYRAEVFLQNGYICHCTMCQRSSGQPSDMTVLIRPGTLTYLQDQPKYYVSSEFGKRGFCAECGSRIVWQSLSLEDDWLTNLSVGTLDAPEKARMTRHIYADTQLPWYRVCEDLPKLVSGDLDSLIAQWRSEVGQDIQG